MADVIDEDKVRFERKESVSTSMHGFQALIVKPSQSVAAVFGLYILRQAGVGGEGGKKMYVGDDEIVRTIYKLICYAPLVCGLIQLLIWRSFDLRGKKLQEIKRRVIEMQNSVGT